MNPYILSIETATTVCSVSISCGDTILGLKEINNGFTHAENLHVFIQDLLQACSLKPQDLHAIAVSKGPGSYTGLRIGVSAAKGFCYALNIPLIGVCTLQSLALSALEQYPDTARYFCPMLDARRMEVYCAVFNQQLEEVLPLASLVITEKSLDTFFAFKQTCFFGDGMNKCESLLSSLPQSTFIDQVVPSSSYTAKLALKAYTEKRFENVAYFEPLYLKEFYTTVKK